MSDKKSAIKLGECHKPHGIKGGFLFQLYNLEDSCLKPNVEIQITPVDGRSSVPTSGQTVQIKSISFKPKTICYLKDIEDRNMVEAMVPFQIFVDRKYLPKTKNGQYYVHDLLNAAVYSENKLVGTIHDFYSNSAELVVFVIKTTDGEIDIPFTKDFFLEVDVAAQKVVVNLPEYI
jgi:16S rRNA processing protein RimM